MDKPFHPTLCWAWGYLSMLGLKFNHVSKGGHWKNVQKERPLDTTIDHTLHPGNMAVVVNQVSEVFGAGH